MDSTATTSASSSSSTCGCLQTDDCRSSSRNRSCSLDSSSVDYFSTTSPSSSTAISTPTSMFRSLPPIPEYECLREDSSSPDSFGVNFNAHNELAQASHRELAFEWSMLCQDCTDCWTGTDLQLAAELGKTLLERNKELETSLKHQQAIIDDQSQEIEYLTKQNAALREVNDSRVKIYEHLEESMSELEAANKRLVDEAKADKARIKSLCDTVERLEMRTDELQRSLDEARSASPASPPMGGSSHSGSSSNYEDEEFEEDEDSSTANNNNGGRRSKGRHRRFVWSHQAAEIDEVEDESEINDHISSLPHHDFFHHQQQETTSTSGYSSSSIESYQLFAAEHATTNSSSSSASMKSRHSPVIEEVEEEEEESIAAEEKLKALSSKYEETADRCRRLESVVARVKMENAALKSEPDSDDLDSIMYQSVQEEVSNVDVVRAGKLCRRCMGPMEEYSPAALIGQAATQVGTVLRKEDVQQLLPPYFSESLFLRRHCFLPEPIFSPKRAAALIAPGKSAEFQLESITSEQPISLQEELIMSGDFNLVTRPLMEEKVTQTTTQSFKTEASQTSELLALNKLTQTTPPQIGQIPSPIVGFPPRFSGGSESPSARTNYKEIFKEIFTVLSKAKDEECREERKVLK